MTSPSRQPPFDPATFISGEMLAHSLECYDVPFLVGVGKVEDEEPLAPALLMSGLALHPDARLRLALIPLLICHPEFGEEARRVADGLPPTARSYFACFYAAARLLQAIYQPQLALYLGARAALPDLFCAELGLPEGIPEETLHVLGERQAELSGRTLN